MLFRSYVGSSWFNHIQPPVFLIKQTLVLMKPSFSLPDLDKARLSRKLGSQKKSLFWLTVRQHGDHFPRESHGFSTVSWVPVTGCQGLHDWASANVTSLRLPVPGALPWRPEKPRLHRLKVLVELVDERYPWALG